jgi:hypothetical protein
MRIKSSRENYNPKTGSDADREPKRGRLLEERSAQRLI